MLVLWRVTMFLIPSFVFVGSKFQPSSFCVILVDEFTRKTLGFEKKFNTETLNPALHIQTKKTDGSIV